MRRIRSGCCACAASGAIATAPLARAMKSRRLKTAPTLDKALYRSSLARWMQAGCGSIGGKDDSSAWGGAIRWACVKPCVNRGNTRAFSGVTGQFFVPKLQTLASPRPHSGAEGRAFESRRMRQISESGQRVVTTLATDAPAVAGHVQVGVGDSVGSCHLHRHPGAP